MRDDVAHWYARDDCAFQECKLAARRYAGRRGAPEMVHRHSEVEGRNLECVGFLP